MYLLKGVNFMLYKLYLSSNQIFFNNNSCYHLGLGWDSCLSFLLCFYNDYTY